MTSPITITATVTDAVGTVFTAKTTASQSGGTTPPPTSTFPDATNTGVPPGTTLTPSAAINAKTAGATYTALDISGTSDVYASNVTFINCRFTNSNPNAGYSLGLHGAGTTGIVIKNCTFIGNGSIATQQFYGVNAIDIGGTFTVDACDISHVAHCIQMQSGHATIQNCYLHDLLSTSSSHYENIGFFGNGSVSMLIQNNTILNTTQSDTACCFFQNYFGPLQNLTIQNNLMVSSAWFVTYVDGSRSGGAVNGPSIKYLNNAMAMDHTFHAVGTNHYWNINVPGVVRSGNYDYHTGANIDNA